MKWDVFTVVEQLIILLTIAGQVWIAGKVILASQVPSSTSGSCPTPPALMF